MWMVITLLFLYERTYLIQKAGLPHLVECVFVRVSLLLLLCYGHNRYLLNGFWQRKQYGRYGLLTGLSVGLYLLLQGLYDSYLFGFVIGDQQRAGLWLNLPYNLVVTGWYLLLTALVNRAGQVVRPEAVLPVEVASDAELTLIVKSGTQLVRLVVAELKYAQGLKDYTILYTAQEKHLVKGSIGQVATWLPQGHFIRVHKSYLVARRYIKSVSATEVILTDLSPAIPLGRSYASTVVNDFKNVIID